MASGITNAEAAEAEFSNDSKDAHSLMEKAIYCFKQADIDVFEEKARIHVESFKFRNNLFNADRIGSPGTLEYDDTRLSVEKAGAELLEKLLKENLLAEARALGREMAKIVIRQYPTSPYLERYVVRQLPGGGGFKETN